MGHYVYKYVYKDEIIYIGKNNTNLYDRLKNHGKPGDNIPEEAWEEINSSDIFYCELANSIMSDVVESELIRRYKPKYNRAKKSDWSGLGFVEPEWKKFEIDKDKIIEKKDKTIKKKDQQIDVLRSVIEDYESERKLNKDWKSRYLSLSMRYYSLLYNMEKKCELNEDAYSFKDICAWYKTKGTISGIFEATAYDSNGKVISYKRIYTNTYGSLCFDFHQVGRRDYSGTIFNSKEDTTKKNHKVLMGWINAGNNMYTKIA